jgi:B-box zinc finger
MKSSAMGGSGQLNIAHATKLFVQSYNATGHHNGVVDSNIGQSMAGLSMGANFSEGNRNYCTKHKRKFVNFCLDHGVPLCASCFKDHQGHKIEMLENYA